MQRQAPPKAELSTIGLKQEKERLKLLIVRVCDQGQTFYKRDINKCVDELSKYLSLQHQELKDFIEDLLLQCVLSLPGKWMIYATIVT